MDSILYATINGVPIITYGMITVTTLALAYFTISDKDADEESNTNIESIPPSTPPQPEITGGRGKNKHKKRNYSIKNNNKDK